MDYSSDKKMITLFLLNLLTCFMAFKEAWGYSRMGTNGIIMITGKKLDHAIWIGERATVFFLVVSAFYLPQDHLLLVVIMASWLAKFIFVHQFIYNTTMEKLKMYGYEMGLKESPHTTANKTTTTFKIVTFSIGIIIPIAYLIIK